MEFTGHDPVEPKLVYLKKGPQIRALIEMRMSRNTLTRQKIIIKLISSSGIKVKDAMKIDAALASMKIVGNTSITSEAESEERRIFEYEIEF